MSRSDPETLRPGEATKNRILELFQQDPSPKTKLQVQCLLFSCRHADQKLLHFSVEEREHIKHKRYQEAARLLQRVLNEAQEIAEQQNRNKIKHRKPPRTREPSPLVKKKLRRIEELQPVRMEPIAPDRVVRSSRFRMDSTWKLPYLGPQMIPQVVQEMQMAYSAAQFQAMRSPASMPASPALDLVHLVEQMTRPLRLI